MVSVDESHGMTMVFTVLWSGVVAGVRSLSATALAESTGGLPTLRRLALEALSAGANLLDALTRSELLVVRTQVPRRPVLVVGLPGDVLSAAALTNEAGTIGRGVHVREYTESLGGK
jgi:hypothetical protein